jgi:hypothetical protein
VIHPLCAFTIYLAPGSPKQQGQTFGTYDGADNMGFNSS